MMISYNNNLSEAYSSTKGQKKSRIYWPFVLVGLIFNFIPTSMKPIIILVALMVLTISKSGRITLNYPKLSILILAIGVVGFLSGLANGQLDHFGAYRFFRDAFYYVCPFLYWTLGFEFGKAIKDEDSYWTTLFLASIAAAISVLFYGLIIQSGFTSLRTFPANELTIFAVILYLFKPNHWYWPENHRGLFHIAVLADLIVIVLSLSRTTIICLLIMLIIFALKNIKNFMKVAGAIACFIAFAYVITLFLPVGTVTQYLDKIQNTFNEVSAGRSSWSDADINENWRGYEVYRAQVALSDGSAGQQLFGFGFGYQLDMGGQSLLVTDDPVGIPYLHNGYMSVLLKCGIVGLALLIVFYSYHFVRLLRIWVREKPYQIGFAAGVVACIVICTYVIHGLFIANSLWYFTIPLAMISGFYLHGNGRNNQLSIRNN